MEWLVQVFSPMLLHLAVTELTAAAAQGLAAAGLFGGRGLDSAACTTVAAAILLPLAFRMYARDRKNTPVSRLSLPRDFLVGAACFIGGGILNLVYSAILNKSGITGLFSNQTQEALFASGLVFQLLGPGILVPAAEELIFRGLTYRRMRMRLHTASAVVFSSLLFALYHGNPIQMIYAFPMAALLSLIYEREGRLYAPVLFHMGANLTAMFIQAIHW